MDKSGYITPPPGLIPAELSDPTPSFTTVSVLSETSRTVQLEAKRPVIPAFVPSVPGAPTVTEALSASCDSAWETPTSALMNTDPQWRLILHDGSVVHTTGILLLGRDPGRIAGWELASLVTINDPEKSVSKTHAAIETTGGEFWITDLHSTNGVSVFTDDGIETVLEPDVRFPVESSSSIELGRYRIVVELD